MGKMKENPRYNVLCFRAADRDYFDIVAAANGRPLADFLLKAAQEKVVRDRQQAVDNYLQGVSL